MTADEQSAGAADAGTVHQVTIAGATMIIQTFDDGRVLVNGQPVEPASVTRRELSALQAGDAAPRGTL